MEASSSAAISSVTRADRFVTPAEVAAPRIAYHRREQHGLRMNLFFDGIYKRRIGGVKPGRLYSSSRLEQGMRRYVMDRAWPPASRC